MFIFNQVINFNESPGLVGSDLDLSANNYPLGTIRFDTHNVSIKRAEGTEGSQTWVTYSGSGSGNLQSVLDNGNEAVNQQITLTNVSTYAICSINENDFYLYKNDDKDIYLTENYERLAIVTDNSVITFGENYISALDNINSYTITARFSADIELFQIEHNGTSNGLKLNYANAIYQFGDYANLNNNTYIEVKDSSQDITLKYNNRLNLNGTLVTSPTSGSNASLHLVVWINGSEYKIQLKNP